MKVAEVKRTINGYSTAFQILNDCMFSLDEDKMVTLLEGDFTNVAEGFVHEIFTTTDFSQYHMKIGVMVKTHNADNFNKTPPRFQFEIWYVRFYPAGQDGSDDSSAAPS